MDIHEVCVALIGADVTIEQNGVRMAFKVVDLRKGSRGNESLKSIEATLISIGAPEISPKSITINYVGNMWPKQCNSSGWINRKWSWRKFRWVGLKCDGCANCQWRR